MSVVLVGLAIWGWLALAGHAQVIVPWGGVDENVIGKVAANAGREARAPLFNTNQGDILLFIFAFGGAVAGFVAGYCWRKIITERKK